MIMRDDCFYIVIFVWFVQGLRTGDAVELPTDDVVMEDGRLPCGRQHRCSQTGRGVPFNCSEIRRVGRQGRNSTRSH